MAEIQKVIFTVDDNEINLASCNQILKPYYTVYPILSAEKMFKLMEKIKPDLILLDIEMPGMNGFEAAKILKENNDTKEIPLVFLSAVTDAASEAAGISMGILDYIHKPFVSTMLLRRIEIYFSLLDQKKILEEVQKSLNKIIDLANESGHAEQNIKIILDLSKNLLAALNENPQK